MVSEPWLDSRVVCARRFAGKLTQLIYLGWFLMHFPVWTQMWIALRIPWHDFAAHLKL